MCTTARTQMHCKVDPRTCALLLVHKKNYHGCSPNMSTTAHAQNELLGVLPEHVRYCMYTK